MNKIQLASKRSIVESVEPTKNNKRNKLSDIIEKFIISNMFNVFKIIYIKECKTKKSWYENITKHVGGVLKNGYLKFNVEIITYVYSDEEQIYITHKNILQNVVGYNVVDACFSNIEEVSFCDMLVIRMKVSKDSSQPLTILGQDTNYHCCYLFARE